MSELRPADFADLTTRLFVEPMRQNSLFELPRKRWHLPSPDWPDMTVTHFGRRAGNPFGPAAGPHTQMAQNILLSYAVGGRILELKTVQINDRLEISRPCIDMTTLGYNVEWSQELPVEHSIREYVAGAMLIEMFRRDRDATDAMLEGPAGEVLYDVSVGYDLEGVKSPKVGAFLDAMRNASQWIELLRNEIPRRFKSARDAEYPAQISSSITLSTFHGCPPGEIEAIARFLIGECDFDLVVKMNPPTLGRERLEYLLHDVMGYDDIDVHPAAYQVALPFDDAVALYQKLRNFAAQRRRQIGFKFTNTLEVLNRGQFFSSVNETAYLSGAPLHVIALDLLDRFRQAVGPEARVSFSAGIDKHNFPLVAAAGVVPVTVCTDMLREKGYGRGAKSLKALRDVMKKVGAANMDEYILCAFNKQTEAEAKAADAPPEQRRAAAVRWAGLLNSSVIAELARADDRYHSRNRPKPPKRGDSQLTTFDCTSCEHCVRVCPNAAIFVYPTVPAKFEYQDWRITPANQVETGPARKFKIERKKQIALWADFCNECGNCDTFCPERGGPYKCKPAFHSSEQAWRDAAPRDGCYASRQGGEVEIVARINTAEARLRRAATGGAYAFDDGVVKVTIDADGVTPLQVAPRAPLAAPHDMNMQVFHTLRLMLAGVVDDSRINMINAERHARN